MSIERVNQGTAEIDGTEVENYHAGAVQRMMKLKMKGSWPLVKS